MEKEYPIWRISARWNQVDYQGNATGFTTSFRRNLSEKSVMNIANKWWKNYTSKKLQGKNPELLNLEVKYLGKEVWFGTWFAHKSLNRFDTEKEAFKSFSDYIWRCKITGDDYDVRYITKDGFEYCPMGSEDRYRWKYCDKNCCKKRKQTIISH